MARKQVSKKKAQKKKSGDVVVETSYDIDVKSSGEIIGDFASVLDFTTNTGCIIHIPSGQRVVHYVKNQTVRRLVALILQQRLGGNEELSMFDADAILQDVCGEFGMVQEPK